MVPLSLKCRRILPGTQLVGYPWNSTSSFTTCVICAAKNSSPDWFRRTANRLDVYEFGFSATESRKSWFRSRSVIPFGQRVLSGRQAGGPASVVSALWAGFAKYRIASRYAAYGHSPMPNSIWSPVARPIRPPAKSIPRRISRFAANLHLKPSPNILNCVRLVLRLPSSAGSIRVKAPLPHGIPKLIPVNAS